MKKQVWFVVALVALISCWGIFYLVSHMKEREGERKVLASCSKVIEVTPQMKEDLIEQMVSQFPDYVEWLFKRGDPYIWTVFFADNGFQLALATTALEDYLDVGWYWFVYRFTNGQWQILEEAVAAAPVDFYILTEEGQKPKLIVIQADRKSVMFDDNGKTKWKEYISRLAYQLTIDKEGRFKAIPIPEFEIKDVYMGIDKDPESYCFEGFPEIKLKSPNDKLEPAHVETFYPKGFMKED